MPKLKPAELEKLTKAISKAGVVVPTDPALFSKVAAELAREGAEIEPDWYIAGGSHYVLVCPD